MKVQFEQAVKVYYGCPSCGSRTENAFRDFAGAFICYKCRTKYWQPRALTAPAPTPPRSVIEVYIPIVTKDRFGPKPGDVPNEGCIFDYVKQRRRSMASESVKQDIKANFDRKFVKKARNLRNIICLPYIPMVDAETT